MGEENTYLDYLNSGRIYFPKGGDGMPRKKYYQFEREEEGQCATNWWPHEQFGHNQGANDNMTQLFGIKNVFSNPKPVELLRAIIKIANVKKDDVILDFFSGSASTAHAIMQLNTEDSNRRKFIMIQVPEVPDEKTEAYRFLKDHNKAITICEIGKERIRRAGEKIKEETETANAQLKLGEEPKQVPDIGFKVFRTSDTNIKWNIYNELGQIDTATMAHTPDLADFTYGFNDIDVVYEVLIVRFFSPEKLFFSQIKLRCC